MYETHYFTRNKVCPCKMDEIVIKQTIEIFNNSENTSSFVQDLEKRRIKGKKIWYDENEDVIFISKISACDCGDGNPENDNLIGQACHCDHYNHSKEFFPKHYCH